VDPAEVNFIQTGGQVENLTALLNGKVDAAAMLVTRRALLRTHAPVLERFMRAMAEAVNIRFKDKELTYKVLGKYLHINDRKILDAAYDEEIKIMEPRMEFKLDSIQAIVDETAKADPRVKRIKPQDLVDRSLLDKLQIDGFFDKLGIAK